MTIEELSPKSPFEIFEILFEDAKTNERFDASRFALATANQEAIPFVRFLLLKGVSEQGFEFYTNYESPKAKQMDANPVASMAFHWESTGIQIRIDGAVARLESRLSDAYFSSRGRGSQIGAWASAQSQELASRDILNESIESKRREFEGKDITRPPFWGGYRLIPTRIEFWWNREDRLHDRLEFERNDESAPWSTRRLFP